jgi:hypothetical protein
MPSGKTHDAVTLLLIVPTFALSYAATTNFPVSMTVAAAFLFGGLMFGPDLDTIFQAVISNPRISEQEVEKIAAMRSITEDVLRQIASNRQWTRSYSIMHNLARNPRTPIANVLNILSRMQLRDLTALSKNRNVSDAVRRQALRLSQTRTGN